MFKKYLTIALLISIPVTAVAATFTLHADKSEKSVVTGGELIGIEDDDASYAIKWITPASLKTYFGITRADNKDTLSVDIVSAGEYLSTAVDGKRYAEIPNTVALTSAATLGRFAWLTDRLWLANGTNWTSRWLLDSTMIGVSGGVQGYDTDLGTYAGITPSANVQSILSAANYAAVNTLLNPTPADGNRWYEWTANTVAVTPPSGKVVSYNDAGGVPKIGIDGTGYEVLHTGQVRESIGWAPKDIDVDTAVADGKQMAVIPASMNNMTLTDLTCSIATRTGATGGATTVVLRRVRGTTPVDMTNPGVTIEFGSEYANDETVVTAGSANVVQTGDMLFIDTNSVTTGAVQKGLGCTATFTR